MNLPKSMRNGLWADLLLVLVLALLLVLLRTLGPQESLESRNLPRHGSPPDAAQPAQQLAQAGTLASKPAPPLAQKAGSRWVSQSDTINGERISDPIIIERIERIAAGVPAHLLADHPPAPGVRYLAHGFGPGDDAAIFYGLFHHAAAALAFGCALDHHLADRCDMAPVSATAAYEEPPGVRCVPLRLALGAPSYEPDRCEASG
jgi:hypothetical protein